MTTKNILKVFSSFLLNQLSIDAFQVSNIIVMIQLFIKIFISNDIKTEFAIIY